MAEREKDVTVVNPRAKSRPSPFAEIEKADDIKGTLKRIVLYFAEKKLLVLGMFAVVLGGTIFNVLVPSFQSDAIDIIAGEKTGSLIKMLIFMFAGALLYSICRFFQEVICAKLSQYIVKRMRVSLFNKLIDLPVRYLDQHSHGDVMSRMTNDVENVSNTISQALPSLFSGVLTIIGTIVMMLYFCWQLTILTCLTVLLTIFVTRILTKKMRKYSRKRQQLLGNLNGRAEEIINGYRTVVAYNHQDESEQTFSNSSDDFTKTSIRTNSIGGIFGPMMNSISNLSFIVVAAFGGIFAINNIISVGVISAFIVYARQFSQPLNMIAQVFGQIQTAIAGAERVFSILDEADEDMDGEEMKDVEDVTLRFENVGFSYVDGKEVLHDFTLTVPSGKKVALVGATGSGKTTVVNLLMRFYDINSGHIMVNGQDLKDISRTSLRRNVAIVLQDTMLFTDTVRNNLLYGNTEASEDDIRQAAQMSHSLGFIEALPEGWDTMLTGSGENLSQGQRQLLAIARAFVADAKVLILDEATSNVDTRTEKAVQDAMQKIMENRTSIVIAHRLSTIKDADIIVVVDHGNIVESGSHRELLARGGKYSELYMTQYSGTET